MHYNVNVPDNEIWYTSVKNEVLTPDTTECFKDASGNTLEIKSNTMVRGIGKFKFEKPVVKINGGLFQENYKLTGIYFPKTIESIMDEENGIPCLAACFNLNAIGITSPNSYYYSNNNCLISKADNSIVIGTGKSEIPSTAKNIGALSFYGLPIKELHIPSNIDSIGDMSIAGCYKLKKLTIDNGVKTIGSMVCFYMYNVENIVIPDSVTSIGENSFMSYKTRALTIGKGLTTLGDGCFNPMNLDKISVSSENTSFESTGNNLIVKGTKTLYKGTSSSIMPNDIKIIKDHAFATNTGLTSINIPDSVTKIGEYAFDQCTSLETVTIGSGITEIGIQAFDAQDALHSITIKATIPPTLGSNAIPNKQNMPNLKIYVPSESITAYKAAASWKYNVDQIYAIE